MSSVELDWAPIQSALGEHFVLMTGRMAQDPDAGDDLWWRSTKRGHCNLTGTVKVKNIQPDTWRGNIDFNGTKTQMKHYACSPKSSPFNDVVWWAVDGPRG